MIRIVLETMEQVYRVTVTHVAGLKETPLCSDLHNKHMVGGALEAIRQSVRHPAVSDWIEADQPETPEHT